MYPLWHVPLYKPEHYQYMPPPGVLIPMPSLPLKPLVIPSEHTNSLLPGAQSFQRLKSQAVGSESAKTSPVELSMVSSTVAPSPIPFQSTGSTIHIEDRRHAPSVFERVDPFYALAVYVAFALGTLFVDSGLETRYTFLWSLLILLGGTLSMLDSQRERRGFTSKGIVWGLGIGFLIGLPLLVLTTRGLSQASKGLFPYATLPGLFQTLVFLGPLGETVFFRGLLQERRGFVASVIGATIGNVMLYWPAGGNAAIIAVFLSMTAVVYTYVRERYGLGASYACQVTLNLMLFFVPRILAAPLP
jgi:membrane protease YdiL (CAAX protease family)